MAEYGDAAMIRAGTRETNAMFSGTGFVYLTAKIFCEYVGWLRIGCGIGDGIFGMGGCGAMAAIALLSLPFSAGHIFPTLGVVRELVRKGQRVIYYATDSFRTVIEETGALFREYPAEVEDLCRHAREEHVNQIALLARGLRTCVSVIPALIRELREAGVTLLLHEILTPWGKIAASELSIPAVSYVTSLVINKEITPFGYKCRLVLEGIRAPGEAVRIRRLARELESAYRLDCRDIFAIIGNTQPLNLVFTSREFQPRGKELDERFCFVGTSVGKRYEPVEFPLESLRGKQVIYISLGTVLHRDPAFFYLCIRAFAEMDCQIVMAVGDQTDIREFHPIPGHFLIRPYVPQLEVLRHADLFITHGGMNSVNEALYYHVPLIVIPRSADQPIIAGRIAELGVGVRVRRMGLTAKRLRGLAEEVLAEPAYAGKAREIGETLAKAGGCRRAAKEILDYQKRYSR